jgi:putative MATE family efflux protein
MNEVLPESDSSLRVSLFKESASRDDLRYIRSEIWRLGWPVLVGQGLNHTVVLASRVMVNTLGDEALAGVGIGQMILFALITVLGAVGIGVVALLARSVGAGDKDEAGRILKQSLLVGALFSAVLSVVGILSSRAIFRALGSEPEVVEQGSRFLNVLFMGLVPMALGFFISAGLRGAGDTRTPMFVAIGMNLVNIILQYVLIFGKFGFPELGVIGSALGIVISFVMASITLLLLFPLKMSVIPMRLRGWGIQWGTVWRILRIGIPTALEWEMVQIGLIVFISIVNGYGTTAAAAYVIGITIFPFAQLPAFAFATATTTLVGQSLGAESIIRAEASFRQNMRLAFVLMAFFGAFLFLAAGVIIQNIFPSDNPETIRLAVFYVRLIAITQPLMAIGFTVSGGLRGAGDTVPPMIAQATGMYLGRIGLAFIAWKILDTPVEWVLVTMFPDHFIRISIVTIRFLTGKWKAVKV